MHIPASHADQPMSRPWPGTSPTSCSTSAADPKAAPGRNHRSVQASSSGH
jgi:hypothetical protein